MGRNCLPYPLQVKSQNLPYDKKRGSKMIIIIMIWKQEIIHLNHALNFEEVEGGILFLGCSCEISYMDSSLKLVYPSFLFS